MTLVVAIDGPAAAGKGTLARRLALTLGLHYLDSGLLYRATGRRVLLAGQDPADPTAAEAAALELRAADLARDDLRGADADRAASLVAKIPAVRAALMQYQRDVAAAGAVLDGRDIGTVIAPDAPVKLFVTASLASRARRRWLERPDGSPLETIEAEIQARDAQDEARSAAPLRPATDAVLLDTTTLDPDQVFAQAMQIIRKRTGFA